MKTRWLITLHLIKSPTPIKLSDNWKRKWVFLEPNTLSYNPEYLEIMFYENISKCPTHLEVVITKGCPKGKDPG